MYIMKNGAILQQYNINTQTDSIVFYGNSGSASNDTLYIIKNGVVNGRYSVNTDIDSIIFYRPEVEDSTAGTFTDPRDGNVYQIGTNWLSNMDGREPKIFAERSWSGNSLKQ